MLNLLPSNDKNLLDKLSLSIYGKTFDCNIGYVFYDDGNAVGFAALMPGEPSIINAVGIVPERRGRGLGDFFTRAILFRLSSISESIVVAYVSDYFLKFGFTEKTNCMQIMSEKIVFPSDCKH